MNKSNFLEDEVVKHVFRTGSFTKPTELHVGLIPVDLIWTPTTAVSLNDLMVPTTPAGNLFIVTTSGTTGGSEPTFDTNPGATTADASVVWTEMTLLLKADTGTTIPEVTGGSYARVQRDPLDANWDNPTPGDVDNAADIAFPSPTANWGIVAGFFIADAATLGNLLYFGVLTTTKTVNNGDAAPTFSAGALTAAET